MEEKFIVVKEPSVELCLELEASLKTGKSTL